MPAPPAVDPQRVRDFVLAAITAGRSRLPMLLQAEFAISRATAHNYLRALIAQGVIAHPRHGVYELVRTREQIALAVAGLEEHAVWEERIQPVLKGLSPSALDTWHYGCTEMVNNVIDHSESPNIMIEIDTFPNSTAIRVMDFGVGIFRKIARALGLEDDRHAVLELSKGKVTTDPANHTGEGIFFSSRTFDSFRIFSGGVFFAHDGDDDEDWILGDEQAVENPKGTSVHMTLRNDSERRLSDVFDEYASDENDYRFDKTVVPVKLLQCGDERLVSRSQAKRLLQRFDRFRTVVLNFEGVDSIGQAFADEIFRVFPSRHPEVDIVPTHANEQVTRMIHRAMSGRDPQADLFTSQPPRGRQS